MQKLLRLLPQSLLERIFALYSIALLAFVLVGLGSFYYFEFNGALDDANDSTTLLSEVMAPTITDSAVIGDYDAIRRTLQTVVVRSQFATATFIDVNGGVVRVENAESNKRAAPPDWLQSLIAPRLFDINRVIGAGGRDYGVLRLQIAPAYIAGALWLMTRDSLGIAAACFLLGIVLIRFPLSRWLGNLDRMRTFEWESQTGESNPQQLLSEDVPREIRQTFEVLNRTANSLQVQRARAEITLGVIADGVITTDSHGRIVYANPVATALFAGGEGPLMGQDLGMVLPTQIAAVFSDPAQDGERNRLVELNTPDGAQSIIELSWTRLSDVPGTTSGFVLTCRDVTATQILDRKLRAELDSRRAALDSLRDVIKDLQGDSDLCAPSSDDIPEVSRFIVELSREQARMTSLLEKSERFAHATVDALPAHLAILDENGTIIAVNRAWRDFATAHGGDQVNCVAENANYLDYCDAASGPDATYAAQLAAGIRSVMDGGKDEFSLEYPCTSPADLGWFNCRVTRFPGDGPSRLVVTHQDITERKKATLQLEESRRRELDIGNSIQRSLLKDEVPKGVAGALMGSFTEASQGIDGDFYAIRPYHSACFEILVGDVMGKGVPAALIGAAIKIAYHQVLADLLIGSADHSALPTPAEIVNRLHHVLTPRLIGLYTFATLALYRFDLDKGTLTYVNAGHTAGLLTRTADATAMPIMGHNLPIGVMPEEHYVESVIAVGPGDSLVVYSDGLTEARNAEAQEFGIERLASLLNAGRHADLPPTSILHSIRQELHHFVGGEQLKDDLTALMIKLQPRRHPPRGSIEQRVNPFLLNLPWRLDSLAALRSSIEDYAVFMPEEDIAALVLASFEAATNIIRHTPPRIIYQTLTCRITRLTDALIVELIYPGEAFVRPSEIVPDFSGVSESGFGLFIIEQSVDSVEYGSPMPGIASIRMIKRRSVGT